MIVENSPLNIGNKTTACLMLNVILEVIKTVVSKMTESLCGTVRMREELESGIIK